MNEVTSILEAEIFFRANSKGNVICVTNNAKKEVDCYPEAVKFFQNTD